MFPNPFSIQEFSPLFKGSVWLSFAWEHAQDWEGSTRRVLQHGLLPASLRWTHGYPSTRELPYSSNKGLFHLNSIPTAYSLSFAQWLRNLFLACRTFIQNVRQAISALSVILSPCQTFFQVDDWQISVAILVFIVGYSLSLWLLNAAGQNVRQGLSSLPDISRSLPDMSGIFRDHCLQLIQQCEVTKHSTSMPEPLMQARVILAKISQCSQNFQACKY